METSLPGILQIVLAVALIAGLAWTLLVMYRYYQIDERPIRLSRMMRRLGIGLTTGDKSQFEHYLPTAVRLCRGCKNKAECDAWLTKQGRVSAPPAFCPNAGFLRLVARQGNIAA